MEKNEVDAKRCPVCGHLHPLVKVCPYIKSQTVSIVREGGRISARTVKTEYYPRPEIAKESIASLDEEETE